MRNQGVRMGIASVAAGLWAGLWLIGAAMAGSLEPTAPPGPTMKTLEEIYVKIEAMHKLYRDGDALAADILEGKTAWVEGEEVVGAMPNIGAISIKPGMADQTVPPGYHSGEGKVEGDAFLVAENIRKDCEMFGVTGVYEGPVSVVVTGAVVAKTGQTQSFRSGDDGDLRPGMAWPEPRFTDHGDGTVTDNRTGLMWAKNANYWDEENSERPNWNTALSRCNELQLGGHSDWRLPTVKELFSLLDPSQTQGTGARFLPDGHPFVNVQGGYWSSTTVANNTDNAWPVRFGGGWELTPSISKSGTGWSARHVWPVRGGAE